MKIRLHQNEIAIDTKLVRRLVDNAFPEYSSRPLTRLDASGSTNVLFRLGDDLLVRLPRQPGGGAAIEKERRWLPELAHRIPVAVPEIVALGEPAFGFGERWSIVRWLDGELPNACTPEDPATPERLRLANDLADVIIAIRSVDVPPEALTDPTLRWYRGRPLVEFDAQTRDNIEKCRSLDGLDLDLDAALALWSRALELPAAFEPPRDRWYHGDLVAENLLVTNGRLTGVLDFGGLAVGDPTIDLHGAWEILDAPARHAFRERLGVGDDEWIRGRAWALAIALSCFAYYWDTMPGRRRDRLAMARSVLSRQKA